MKGDFYKLVNLVVRERNGKKINAIHMYGVVTPRFSGLFRLIINEMFVPEFPDTSVNYVGNGQSRIFEYLD